MEVWLFLLFCIDNIFLFYTVALLVMMALIHDAWSPIMKQTLNMMILTSWVALLKNMYENLEWKQQNLEKWLK